MTGWMISAARHKDIAAALQLLFARAAPEDQWHRLERTKRLLRSGELQADGLRIIRHGNQLLGAMLAAPAPGRVGLVWPPQAAPGLEHTAVEDALVQDTLMWLGGQGVCVCQALLRPEELDLGAPLLRNGFRHITSLSYLRSRLESDLVVTPTLQFRPFSEEAKILFTETLQRTYEATLDCPELNGVRSMDDVLAGHRAQGSFDSARWWLASHGDEPAGVLLINALVDEMLWEITYMGLIPSLRGQGLGRQLLAQAMHEARQARVRKLTLAVDRRNVPALQLYRRTGFEVVEQREVFLAILPPDSLGGRR